MNTFLTIAAAGLAAVALTACVEESGTRAGGGLRDASSNAESACMSAVNSRFQKTGTDHVLTEPS